LVGVGLACALAPAARAQGAEPEKVQGTQEEAGTSAALEQACVDLLHGRLPPGGKDAIDGLKRTCSSLMDTRSSAHRETEGPQAGQEVAAAKAGSEAATGTGAKPGEQSQAAEGQGSEAAQGMGGAFALAGRELTQSGGTNVMGRKSAGKPIGFSLVTNPIGYFNGLGINAEAFGSLIPAISWVGGLRYSRTDATNGTVNTFGMEVGADYFLYGHNNEGLRIGPRLELALGRETFASSTNFAWLGLAGELGYNFVATNGITGVVAAGVGGRIAGDEREDFTNFTGGGEFGPYAKLGLGFSW
jgi:hypothetical protein